MSQDPHAGRHDVGVDPIRRFVDWLSSTALFASVAPKIVPRADRFLFRVTGGRFMTAQARMPGLMLTTTGHRSGQPREAPLACLPQADGTFLVVGSNFGRTHHPAWTANLLAHPHATIGYRRRTIPVVASMLDDAERAEIWDRLVETFPNFDQYQDRSGRSLRVFRLTPVAA
jgi:deazaflavin-dependent oxidoreductase (nitroreductase family)